MGGVEGADPARGIGLPGESGAKTVFLSELGADRLDDDRVSGHGRGEVDLGHYCSSTKLVSDLITRAAG